MGTGMGTGMETGMETGNGSGNGSKNGKQERGQHCTPAQSACRSCRFLAAASGPSADPRSFQRMPTASYRGPPTRRLAGGKVPEKKQKKKQRQIPSDRHHLSASAVGMLRRRSAPKIESALRRSRACRGTRRSSPNRRAPELATRTRSRSRGCRASRPVCACAQTRVETCASSRRIWGCRYELVP